MTTKYLGEWLHDANHYRMQLQGDAADNPDQRIADDVKMFVERTLDIGVGLLNSDRHAGVLCRHPLGPVGRRRRCICSAASSQFPAIWSGPR